MTSAPLQLSRYFMTECHVTASRQFKSSERVTLNADQLEVESACDSVENGQHWEVKLRVIFQPGPEVNTPYFFTLELVGFFSVVEGYPEERTERLVRTNGPSMLYGVAREVIRQMTGRGPHTQILLPSVSFVPRKAVETFAAEAEESSTEEAEKPAEC
jgi:preprotein translocase subunit SecB